MVTSSWSLEPDGDPMALGHTCTTSLFFSVLSAVIFSSVGMICCVSNSISAARLASTSAVRAAASSFFWSLSKSKDIHSSLVLLTSVCVICEQHGNGSHDMHVICNASHR